MSDTGPSTAGPASPLSAADAHGRDWAAANQRALLAALATVRTRLQAVAGRSAEAGPAAAPAPAPGETDLDPRPANLQVICSRLGLSVFERDLLVLCAGVELCADFAGLCAAAQGDPRRSFPTVALALALWPEHGHWDALTPVRPLRRLRLIEMGPGGALQIDEWALHYLAGVTYLDERLHHLMAPVTGETVALPASQRELAQRVARCWDDGAPLLQLCGDDPRGKLTLFVAACAERRLLPCCARATDLALAGQEREAAAALWEREALLRDAALLIEFDERESPEATRAALFLAERLRGPVALASRDPLPGRLRAQVRFTVDRPRADEQLLLWRQALAPLQVADRQLDAIVEQFNLGAAGIADIAAQVRAQPERAAVALWETCRAHGRPRLSDLAQQVQPAATKDELILPDLQKALLADIVTQVRFRTQVYERWGFSRKGLRGLGVTALFVGPSGTGKTMAAEVLAGELDLDLYRVDLSAVVSKYIGETEKNLRRVFDAAEEGGSILLFDEADALFGKRSEVKDSHDRYANIEVSYLLQRMEAYRGLAILTSNMKEALDTAFLRRIRYVVHFPFPDPAERARIWAHVFPAGTPHGALDTQRLARLNIAGGNIRNIAIGAAFAAAAAGSSEVTMAHVQTAARGEYAKLERPLTETEMGGPTHG